MKPFFSVIITTYNRAALLTRALDSLLAQSEQDWEAIVVDDGSQDSTYCTAMSYLKKDERISYIRQLNRGEAEAKNTGIRAARGKYVTFLDSDDEYSTLHLSYRKSILLANPAIKFLHGGIKVLGNRFVPDRFNPDELIDLGKCVIGGSFFVDRSLISSLNGFRKIRPGEDADLFDRIMESGARMQEISRPTYIYHHDTPDSVTNSIYSQMHRND